MVASTEIYKSLNHQSFAMDLPALNDVLLMKQAKQMSALAEQTPLDVNQLLGQDWVDIAPLEAHLDQALKSEKAINDWYQVWFNASLQKSGQSLRDQLQSLKANKEQNIEKIRRQIKQKQMDTDALETAQVNYPIYTKNALEAIRRECPQADPRVLCDYVEVIDADWQSSIEGYIGGARYSILVNTQFEAQAISIVRAMSRSDSRARIIQGSKAKQDSDKIRLSNKSIIHLMQFEHATAKDYLMAMYASVDQVNDSQALARTRRGLTADGMGSGGYAMFRCDMADSELVFGQGARERALKAKNNELNLLAQTANQAEQVLRDIQQFLFSVNQLRTLSYGQTIENMLQTRRKIQQAESQLQQMDLSDFKDLEVEFQTLKDKEIEADHTISKFDVLSGELDTSLKLVNKQCDTLSKEQEACIELVDQRELDLQSIQKIWSDFDYEQRLQQADEQAGQVTQQVIDQQLSTVLQELNSKAFELERNVVEHNQTAQGSHLIVFTPNHSLNHDHEFFGQICHLSREIDRVQNKLENNILVEKSDQLIKLKDDFSNAFVLNLCHSIYQAINDGKTILEELNKELEHHRFGADQEKYRFDWQWIPEFKEYWNFFKEIINNPELGEGQNLFNSELTDQSKRVRDQLLSMLLDEDAQKAMRELERLSDYRNYRSYEIYKEPLGKDPIALSQYGTGSGGQLETPAYIIRSAAITSAFKFNEGDSHLRMVLVDEAFSKMDETRSKEVIDYLTKTQGLQLLFIMPTSKSGPFMDLISNQFVFTKVPMANGKKIGTLNTRVLVDRQSCNAENIKTLWANHRKIIRKQAELDFLDEL